MSDPTVGNDSVLIEYCQKGDRAAFDLLVRRYERKAYQLAFRLCNGSSDDAGDVVAEAFLRVFTSIKTFRQDASFTTWLFRIVTNVFLDIRKRERLRSHESLDAIHDLEEGSVTPQIADPLPGPDAAIDRDEREQLLQKAINRLPDYQRAMVLMFHVEGLSYEEIAEAMELPLGTVKSRLNRARLSLKQYLSCFREQFET
ncbi:MAG: sigma-70 family RNA polymerase sigma factor [bacterium]|jgi:RNA polymerase sigma-70 factor (ECF subfamily)